MIDRIDHLVLTVADIDRAVEFYVTVLGMKPVTHANGRKGVSFGEQMIKFQLLGDEMRNHALEGSGDLCLISSWTMEELLAYFKQANIELLEGPVEKQGAQGPINSVYLHDLDNNLIEISVYTS